MIFDSAKMAELIECPICIMEVDELVRCYKCHTESCSDCLLYYLSRPEIPGVTCMNNQCEGTWRFSVLRKTNIPQDVIDRLYEKRIDELLELEKSYMQGTYRLKIIDDTRLELEQLRSNVGNVAYNYCSEKRMPRDWKNRVSRVREELKNYKRVKEIYESLQNEEPEVAIVERCTFEECSGYITDLEWRCQTCQGQTCRECLAPIRDETRLHVCSKEDLDTLRELNANTVKCPNTRCGARVSRIEGGCDDMWCVACNTPFDYSTRQIIDINDRTNRRYHYENYHYRQYLERMNDPQLMMDNFGCFINGDLTEDDIAFAPRVREIFSAMVSVILIDRIIEEKHRDYDRDTMEKSRREIIDKGYDIDSPEVLKEFRRRIKIQDMAIERITEYSELFSSFSRIMKDLIIEFQRDHRSASDDEKQAMLQEFKRRIDYLQNIYLDFIDISDEIYRPYTARGLEYIQDLKIILVNIPLALPNSEDLSSDVIDLMTNIRNRTLDSPAISNMASNIQMNLLN